MENLNTAGGQIVDGIVNVIQEDIDKYVADNKKLQAFLIKKGKLVDIYLPKFNKFLKPYGFEISSIFNIHKTGLERFSAPKPGDQLVIDARLKMIGRRKPVKRMHDFNKNGTSVGAKVASKIVDGINSNFKKLFGDKFGIGINQFSLDRSEEILGTFWIK
jgi:hypothetical protein